MHKPVPTTLCSDSYQSVVARYASICAYYRSWVTEQETGLGVLARAAGAGFSTRCWSLLELLWKLRRLFTQEAAGSWSGIINNMRDSHYHEALTTNRGSLYREKLSASSMADTNIYTIIMLSPLRLCGGNWKRNVETVHWVDLRLAEVEKEEEGCTSQQAELKYSP